MKKIVLIIFILSTSLIGYTQEDFAQNTKSEQEEINLDIITPYKTYQLNKPTFNNPTEKEKYDDEDMPIDFFPTPLKLLKQYMQNPE